MSLANELAHQLLFAPPPACADPDCHSGVVTLTFVRRVSGKGDLADYPCRGNTQDNDAAAAVRNFLDSLQGSQNIQNNQSQAQGQIYTTLPDLLATPNTIPVIESADQLLIDNLLSHLPPTLLLQSQEADDASSADPSPETAKAALEALSLEQKKEILRKVLRSPQFSQSLGSLTQAIRDGGLPTISDALEVPVAHCGFVKEGSGVPQGGGDAVEAFVVGVKEAVKRKRNRRNEGDERTETE